MAGLFPGINFGPEVREIVKDESCNVLKIENETGEGLMTCYRIFPGVVVMFNDFHMSYCVTQFQTAGGDLLCLDHCREGGMERLLRPDVYYYFSTGDVTVDNRNHHAGRTNFPQSHFHGVSVGFYLPQAEEQLARELAGFPVSLRALQQKFCAGGDPCALQNAPELSRAFQPLYQLPQENQREFLRLKVFELLLYLDGLPPPGENPRAYFYKSQVEKTRAAHRLLTQNPGENYTTEQLAARFGLSQSALKSCFKAMYGLPVHSWLQKYRMEQAARLLKARPRQTVAQVAGQVGYDSPGKFAAIFKRQYGVTPKEYRNGGLL